MSVGMIRLSHHSLELEVNKNTIYYRIKRIQISVGFHEIVSNDNKIIKSQEK